MTRNAPATELQAIADGLWTTDIMKSFPLGVRMPLRASRAAHI